MCRNLFLALTALVLTGCTMHAGTTPQIKRSELEQGIGDSLQRQFGQRPAQVDCPDPIAAKVGESFRCVLVGTDKTRVGLSGVITEVNGTRFNYKIQVDDKPMS
ncbi:DUF4333 domain-containing protein [Amycolatopsis acidicola]|uniref:DUF4333 domain-containing protein n=1 Tax=Amycolatopsis acidicola TaxID=2596893 RepID=A0A5N0UP25_9PSEU|nr:DUF4333 domain-containing protein [Amycolatopsis acidicola]KAA9152229.1 DUF4333 domain-containing protein [Amycolatopsis acidicola]